MLTVEWVDSWVTWLKARGLTKSTVYNYRLTAKSLAEAGSSALHERTLQDLEAWLGRPRRMYKGSTVASAASKNRDIAIIRSLWAFGVSHGHTTTNPTLALMSSKDRAVAPVTVPEEVFEQLWAHGADKDRVWLLLARYAGLRRSEFGLLKWGEMKRFRDTGELLIMRKGQNEQTMPLEELLTLFGRQDLEKFLHQWVGVHGGSARRHVFSGSRYNDLTWVNKRLSLLCEYAHVDPVTPHQLRHTFCTDIVNMGVPLPLVSHLMGHKDLSVTSRYVHVKNHDLTKFLDDKQDE